MPSKSDIKIIKDLLKPLATKKDLEGFATRNDLKAFATKEDLRKELQPIKDDISEVKDDIKSMKVKLNEFASVTIDTLGNILDWTQEIHRDIVQEKLPERVRSLEHLIKTS